MPLSRLRLHGVGVGTVLTLLGVLPGCEPSPERQPLPCDVAEVLSDKCGLCHNENLDFGAPMPLLDWQDVQGNSMTSGRPIWQEIEIRTHNQADPMPPVGQPSINFDEHDVLDKWARAGGPAGTVPCSS